MISRSHLTLLALALGLLTLDAGAQQSATPAVDGVQQAQALQASKAKKKKKGKKLSAKKISKRVQVFYNKTKTYQAGFKQRYWIKVYNKTKKSRGGVVFSKPGKMSFRYKNGNRVVSSGKTVKVYEAEDKQMYEQKVRKSQYPAALSFLTGDGNLRKSFRLRRLNAKKLGFEGGYVLVGKPRKKTPAYSKVLFYIDGQTAQVRRVMLIDVQGNRNRFDFIKPVVNKKPAKGEFKFTPPPGTKIIKP